jgi:hypothetical protein
MGVHDGHRKRLKTQFLIHGEDFHDHQLLELLLCYAIPRGRERPAHALLTSSALWPECSTPCPPPSRGWTG